VASKGILMQVLFKTFPIVVSTLFIFGCATGSTINDLKNHTGQVNAYGEDEKKILFSAEYGSGSDFELGISLSGGGIRASSFSIGALAGLYDSGVLQQTDYLSTVSGGGYAGYWYMNNLLYANDHQTPFNYDMLFDDCYPDKEFSNYAETINKFYENCKDTNARFSHGFRFQNHVNQQGDLLHYYQDGIKFGREIQISEEVFKWTYHIGTIIPHHIGNSVFDWGWNVSGVESRYLNGIERTFGLVPSDLTPTTVSTKIFLNPKSSWGFKNAKAQPLSFERLQDFTIDSMRGCSKVDSVAGKCMRAPLWILNATAGVANRIYTWLDSRPPLSKSVFEITPFSFGSGEYGYADKAFPFFDVSKAVAVSGAAADPQFLSKEDSKTLRFGAAVGLHSINLGIGEKIRNYNPQRASKVWHSLLPWPFYYLHGFSRNNDSTHIYLSDGGHSENLGAYSLIVRGVKNIIIIDTEHDDKGNFGALRLLQDSLNNEHGLVLSFDKMPNNIDVQEATNNIFEGTVTGYKDGYISGDGIVNVVYVKSAIRKQYMSPDCADNTKNSKLYPCSTYTFYSENNLQKASNGKCDIPKRGSMFPHHSTAKTAYEMSQELFFAYRDFARHITNRISFKNNKLLVDDYNLDFTPALAECK
jgi:hypothetical protein